MLVLSRKPGESIRIGPDVTLTVLAVQGEKVRLGIAAPMDIGIWRTELISDTDVLPLRRLCSL
jgi:carbon storage regulator